MKKFLQQGEVLTCSAPYAVSPGGGFLVGIVFAVATGGPGSSFPLGAGLRGWRGNRGPDDGRIHARENDRRGLDIWSVLYWDISNKKVITTTTGNKFVGDATAQLAVIDAATSTAANPFQSKLELLVEPRLTGLGWYLLGDPAVAPCLEYAYLPSAPGPQLSPREGWNILGAEFRVALNYGCMAIEHRTAYRNPGA
jgi:predicted RecA/RadA family phage recombinase